MSSDVALHSPSASRQPTWSFKIQNFSTPQTYAAKSAVESNGRNASTSPTQTSASTSSTQNAPQEASDELYASHVVRKRRKLNQEEEELKNEIAASVAVNLQVDQIMTLYPDAETPFENKIDAVSRLMPYHIYQHPRHDLDQMRGLKGKAKASETDLLREEVEETKFAVQCHKRLRSLEHRMKRARLKSGRYSTPLDQAILIERMMLETEHTDKSTLEQELSSARSELDKIIRAQRMAKAAANRAASTTPGTAAINGTTSTAPYYTYTAPAFNTTSTPNFASYYGSYTYPYSQSFIPGVSYATSGRAGSSTIPGVSSFQTGAASQGQPPASSSNASTNQPSTTSSSLSTVARPPPVAIPLQLPVTSLPALQSLGILPVPKSSVTAGTGAQSAAVLLGSTNSGTMLSLEINAALLQPHQMSGLAILLSSLVKMSGGANSTGNTPAQTQTISTGGTAQYSSTGGSATQAATSAGAKTGNEESK